MPPVATGIAHCSAEIVAALSAEHEIDIYVDQRNLIGATRGLRSAHEFVWRHQQSPYDLIVYQLGNSSHHDYQWPYLFRYPGLTVLHDAHLHHARAACLLRLERADDYRVEFAANHPEAAPALAELAVAGFDNYLHYSWPMTRLLARSSRVVAVHNELVVRRLRDEAGATPVEAIRLGHGSEIPDDHHRALRSRTRARLGIEEHAFVFGCFGGLSPDKRLAQIVAAFAATRAHVPDAHLLLAGRVPEHFDLNREIERHGVRSACSVTGYLDADEEFTACIAASDATLNLRWPTARETSGPWLRCLAAGKPTVTMDLSHTADVPSLDPRTWRPNAGADEPCTVAIDILDEDHSLRLAMRRLATDPAACASLGAAARRYWRLRHTPAQMVDDYRRLIPLAIATPARPVALPVHLTTRGDATLQRIAHHIGVPTPLAF
jgi:glycosyltransferase involved in cell wall biosynthesis